MRRYQVGDAVHVRRTGTGPESYGAVGVVADATPAGGGRVLYTVRVVHPGAMPPECLSETDPGCYLAMDCELEPYLT